MFKRFDNYRMEYSNTIALDPNFKDDYLHYNEETERSVRMWPDAGGSLAQRWRSAQYVPLFGLYDGRNMKTT
ncbi:hypothetical protein PoB_001112600 [Plakobranchus ocellatus]|uniref:Uncharacterized protein n=1 Tax=Plakobranchus ocellatus TaxID=259542 RepID=A0AAV3YBB3_9GAST|nr:hypothetical protein PoB_001112600 [Plakobranchus ocellatus]